jgi:hypothetical protein
MPLNTATRREQAASPALAIEMTTTPTPDHPPEPAYGDPNPGGRNRGRRLSGLTVRLTAGGYVLAICSLLASGIALPAAALGPTDWPY